MMEFDTGEQPNAGYSQEGTQVLSMDFMRRKMVEFQSTLSALDATYSAMVATSGALRIDIDDPSGDATPEMSQAQAAIQEWLADFEAKRGTAKTIMDGLNLGAALANKAGVAMPTLSSNTLGLLQMLSVPAATVVAIGAIAGFSTIAVSLIQSARGLLADISLWRSLPESTRSQIAIARQQAEAAAAKSGFLGIGGGLSSLGSGLTFLAVAAIGFFLYKEFGGRRG